MAKKKTATRMKAATKKAAPARKYIKPTATRAPKPAKKKPAKKKPAKRPVSIDPATAPTIAGGIRFVNQKRGTTTTANVGLNTPGNAPGAVAVTATCPQGRSSGSQDGTEEINGNIDSVSVYVLGASVYSATYPDSGAAQSVVLTMDSTGNFSSVGWTNSDFSGNQVLPSSG